MKQNGLKNISSYSKERKIRLINEIEKLNWDTSYNPEEFIHLLISDNNRLKDWVLSRLISILPYRTVRLIVTKDFLRENLNDNVYNQIFPIRNQKIIKQFYKRLQS